MGLHWVGPDGIILRANKTELDLLGYSKEEYVGRHISEFHADPPVIQDILQKLSWMNFPSSRRDRRGSPLSTKKTC